MGVYERWDSERCRKRTEELLDEQLFVDLYATLKSITDEYGEPSPAEFWDEAASRWKPLVSSKRPQSVVGLLKEELTEKFGERGAFLVLMIMMYILVAVFRPDKKGPYAPICTALAKATGNHPLMQRFWEGVRQTEDEEEREGRKVGIVLSLLKEKTDAGEAVSFDYLEQRILSLPTFELQRSQLLMADELLRGTEWSKRSAAIEEKMYKQVHAQEERKRDMEDHLITAATTPKLCVEVKEGGNAQITESGNINQIPQLPNKQAI